MRKFIYLLLVILFCFIIVGCDGSSHEGEAKTPSGSSIQNGRDYLEVIKDFEENGFTNIETEKIDDLIFGWLTKEGEVEEVLVGGDVDYESDDWLPADTAVLIRYHVFPEIVEEETTTNDTASEETIESEMEVTEAPDYVKRSAVVALTNYFALDVMTPDGNKLDSTKFHSYSDASNDATKYFFYVDSFGDWKKVGERNWHVDNLVIKSYGYGSYKIVSLDVFDNDTEYIISNVFDTYGTDDSNTSEYDENCSCYVVPVSLVENDRNQSEVDALDHSEELTSDVARRAFEYYGEELFPYGFKCHWILGLINKEQTYDGSWYLKVEVTITNQYGESRKAVAEAYVNNVTDAVENFNVY